MTKQRKNKATRRPRTTSKDAAVSPEFIKRITDSGFVKIGGRSPERAVRRLVHYSVEQAEQLKRLSKRSRTSQAAMFRRGIALVIDEFSKHKESKVQS